MCGMLFSCYNTDSNFAVARETDVALTSREAACRTCHLSRGFARDSDSIPLAPVIVNFTFIHVVHF
jgi:hypothetical protein